MAHESLIDKAHKEAHAKIEKHPKADVTARLATFLEHVNETTAGILKSNQPEAEKIAQLQAFVDANRQQGFTAMAESLLGIQ